MEAQFWDALEEMHKQALLIATLLGGFTMATAIQAFGAPWKNTYQKYSSLSAFVSSVCFIVMVFISALVVFSLSEFEYRLTLFEKEVIPSSLLIPNSFFTKLSLLSLFIGSIGVFSLFVMFALLGWERSKSLGSITTCISVFALSLLGFLFVYVYSYVVSDYGNLLELMQH